VYEPRYVAEKIKR